MTDSRPVAVCVMGPTAAGKTDLVVELVQRYPLDIISVDSAMVYRGLDIGTAKPETTILAIAPHRLIDILDPADAYSVARFRTDAVREMATIHAKGRTPLLVGGTMLYFRALEHGLTRLPAASATVRAQLEADRIAYGSAALHDRLAKIDPEAAARIHPNDPQRIFRALEVYQLTGQSLTELYAQGVDETLPFRLLKLILIPDSRDWLHQQIAKRFRVMLEQGLVDEVTQLHNRADLDLSKPALRAVGYRQVWRYLDGNLDYAEMIEQGIIATRQLAKRQLTWLRAERNAIQLNSQATDLIGKVEQQLASRFF